MGHIGPGRCHTRQGEARVEQWQVESAAIETDHGCHTLHSLVHQVEQGSLFDHVAHEELPHKESIAGVKTKAHQESVSPRPAS